jgi:hypothetical protein
LYSISLFVIVLSSEEAKNNNKFVMGWGYSPYVLIKIVFITFLSYLYFYLMDYFKVNSLVHILCVYVPVYLLRRMILIDLYK